MGAFELQIKADIIMIVRRKCEPGHIGFIYLGLWQGTQAHIVKKFPEKIKLKGNIKWNDNF